MIPKNKIEEASREYYVSNYCKAEESDSIGELNRIFTGGVIFAEKELENLTVEFAEWIGESFYRNYRDKDDSFWMNSKKLNAYTTQELFEIFKQENYESNK